MLHRYLACPGAGHKVILWNFNRVTLLQLPQAVYDLVKSKGIWMVKVEIGNVCCFLGSQVSVEAVLGQVDDHTLLFLHFCSSDSKSSQELHCQHKSLVRRTGDRAEQSAGLNGVPEPPAAK